MIEAEEAQERRNVARAKWSILHNGNVLPVTNLYDSEGEEINDPLLACACVAFDPDLTDGHWLTIGNIDPGEVEVWSRQDGSPQEKRRCKRFAWDSPQT